jgi:hypothetical protein
MTTLLSPANKQPCEFVASVRGHVALRLTCTVSPAIQWFPIEAIEAANPVHTCAEPPQPLIIALPADMLGQVGGGRGKNKRPTIPGVILADCAHVRVIAPVSLYTDSMRAA